MAKNDTPMNAKSNKWFLTINAPSNEKDPSATLKSYMSTLLVYFNNAFISTIIHDKDIQEDGTPKTIHLHAFIEIGEEPTKKAFLNEIIELLGINTEQIGILATNSQYQLVQYLTHKVQTDKTPYNKELVKTNNNEEYERRYAHNYELSKTDYEKLIECKTYTDLVINEGLTFANKYMKSWDRIMEEKRQDIPTLKLRLDTSLQDNQYCLMELTNIIERYETLNMLPNEQDMERLKALYNYLKQHYKP
jgi:hypothetical protein